MYYPGMLSENFPIFQTGSDDKEIEAVKPSNTGRILCERFLIERDLTNYAPGNGFSVFLVKDLRNFCREAVLKIPTLKPEDYETERPSLQKVCETLKDLRHPKIEEIIEMGQLFDGRPYALTAFYSGSTLDRIIGAERRLGLERIADLIEQIGEGLGAAHSEGLVHCDVRPSNVVVTAGSLGEEDIRLINFGSAWPVDVRGESLANAGSAAEMLHYAAPELLVKLGERLPASDVYSLAVLTYRLVTGSVPFAGSDRGRLIDMIKAGPDDLFAESRTDLSIEGANIIKSGLQYEPAWRPQNIEEFSIRLVRSLRPPQGISLNRIVSEVKARQVFEDDVESEERFLVEEKNGRKILKRAANPGLAVSDRSIAWALIVLLLAGALSIPIGQTFLGKNTAAAVSTIVNQPPQNITPRQLKYWIESPTTNARGQLAFTSDTPGRAFVFCEGRGEDGRPSYRLLYHSPAPGENAVEGGKTVKIEPTTFQHTEKARALWIVWTADVNKDLESIRESFTEGALLSNEAGPRLRHFLERNRDLRVEVGTDESNGHTVLSGSGDKIVHRIEIGSFAFSGEETASK